MKKEKRTQETVKPLPRFKHGTGIASWKLAAALVLALAVGIGGGIAMDQSKQKPKMSDHELGLEIDQPTQDVEG